ncbi:MAG TPA: helix-turn-helix domain-containing protein [Solirubrobacterales bacterium]
MEAQLATLLDRAIAARDVPAGDEDPTRTRILDAALEEAAQVGLDRLTVEQVVRRAGLGRMTVYRRFARRDDLVEALVVREGRRFLAAVAAGLDGEAEPADRLAGGFVAAMRFARDHPMLEHLAHSDPGSVTATVAANDSLLLEMGSEFIARTILGEHPAAPTRAARRVADLLARLFLTYIALPPRDPDPHDDEALRAFARDVLAPFAESALQI